MPALGQGRPLAGPLGVALFFATLGAFGIGAGVASLETEPAAPNEAALQQAQEELSGAEGRLLADVAELLEIRGSAGERPIQHGELVVPIRKGAPQQLRIDDVKPPSGGRLIGVGVGLLVIAGLLYLLYPPPPPGRVRQERAW